MTRPAASPGWLDALPRYSMWALSPGKYLNPAGHYVKLADVQQALPVEEAPPERDTLLAIAGLVNAYHNDGGRPRFGTAAQTLRAIADVLGEAMPRETDPPADSLAPLLRDDGRQNRPHEYKEDPETQCCIVCGWVESVHVWSEPADSLAPPAALTSKPELKGIP